MFRILPWRQRGLGALLRLMLAWGLLEGVRSGFYAGYLILYGPKELGLNAAVVGLSFTIHLLADSFGKGVGGYLVQRYGIGVVTIFGAGMGMLALYGASSVKSPLLLFLISGVWGISLASILPGLKTLSSRLAFQGREGRALTLTDGLTAPWAGIGLLGVGLVTKHNPDLAFALLLGGQIAAVLLGISLLGLPIAMRLHKQEYYPWRRLLIFIPAAFGQTFAPAMIGFQVLPFAQKIGLLPWQLVVLMVLGGGLVFALVPFTGRIADRVSPRWLLILGLAVLGVSMFWLASKPGFSEMLLLAVVAGVGFACFVPSWNALVIRILPEANRAAAWGTILMVEGLGFALGPSAGGFITATFSTVSVTARVGGAIFLVLSVFYLIVLWRPFWKR
ncbi:MFS transporter [Calidithermus chliarophilus]|uniref:MFS transporter n=1 Tax=Calidithermus chliarophilus TaxID=52023 RepID=UPI0004829D6B|nr:MFS transporter [Calidithermus chliarophilus]